MNDLQRTADKYRRFAENECKGYSDHYCNLSHEIVKDEWLLEFIAQMPENQPNLFLASIQFLVGPDDMPRSAEWARPAPMYVILLCGAMLLAAPNSFAAEPPWLDAHADNIQSFLREHFADANAGMVIGLIDERGSRVFCAGKLDNGTDQEVTADTVFEIGSITKTFTSLLLLDMARRGEVTLEDPAAKYVPSSVTIPSYGGKQITLLNLAAQDSGLPFNADNFSSKELQQAYNAYTAENMYAFLSAHKLAQPPGARFQYSNLGMSLLGHVMELKSGEGYESLVIDRICRPLKMDSTRIRLSPDMKSRIATGHDKDGNRVHPLNMQVMAPAGSLRSTATDLMKYLAANLGLTKSDLSPLMEKTHVIRHTDSADFGKTAMPWYDRAVYQPADAQILGHGGGTFGFATFIGFDTKQRRAVVVLSNQLVLNSSCIGTAILQRMPLTRDNATQLVREHVGIGAALVFDEEHRAVRISKVFRESPAAVAGLSPGLLIREINGVSVEGKTPSECFTLMPGPAGTKVQLQLFNAEQDKSFTVELTKEKFLTSS